MPAADEGCCCASADMPAAAACLQQHSGLAMLACMGLTWQLVMPECKLAEGT